MGEAHGPARQDPEPDRPDGAVEVLARRQDAAGRRLGRLTRHFGFVQVEFPWELGPADGRYVVRGHAAEPTHVAVLGTLGASRRASRRGLRPGGARRARRARRGARAVPAGAPPSPVPIARATLIAARPFAAAAEAERWLAHVDGEAEVAAALVVLNRLLHLHRTATADPSVREVRRGQALAARVGIGDGDEVADGRWTHALELPPSPELRGRAALRPEERLAALLGGRDAALACEELTLRARSDVAGGRHREAALQLSIALAAAASELASWVTRGDLATRLEELRAARPAVDAAAAAALEGGLDDAAIATVEHALGRLEAALRARSAAGFD